VREREMQRGKEREGRREREREREKERAREKEREGDRKKRERERACTLERESVWACVANASGKMCRTQAREPESARKSILLPRVV